MWESYIYPISWILMTSWKLPARIILTVYHVPMPHCPTTVFSTRSNSFWTDVSEFDICFPPHSPDKIRKCSQSRWKSRFIPFWSFPSSFYQDNPHGTPYFTSELKFGSKSNNLCGCWIRIWHFVFLSLISPKTRWRDNKTDMVNEINHIVPTLYLYTSRDMAFFATTWKKHWCVLM